MATYPYKDSQLSVAQRVSDLLGRMTLPEKIAQMHSPWLILSAEGAHLIRTDPFCQRATTDDLKAMLRLGIGEITRPLGTHPVNPEEGVRALNALQKFLVGNQAWHTGDIPRRVSSGTNGQRVNTVSCGVELWGDLFEKPYVDPNLVSFQSEIARNLAKEVALQSIVLLENKGILPLDVSKSPRMAVIGPTADDQLAMFSGYSFPVHLIAANLQEERVQYAKTPLQVLRERFDGPVPDRHGRRGFGHR